MITIVLGGLINTQQWNALIEKSALSTWFQSPQAYEFLQTLSFVEAFAIGVVEDEVLQGVVVGYLTKEKNALKQFLTRRAIIMGGPVWCDHTSQAAISALLFMCRQQLRKKAIYIETRNFHSYQSWAHIFRAEGFAYRPHYNFHVDTSSQELVQANLGKSRKRDIKTSYRSGVEIEERPTLAQVKDFYSILFHLYHTRIKTPLFPWDFFEKLYALPQVHFLLVTYQNRIIGGTVCVGLPNRALYEWFACGQDGVYKNVYPSTVATAAGIDYAARCGYPLFDMMGAGSPGDGGYGVRDFKAKFGGRLVEHGRFIHICSKPLFAIGKMGVALLKRLK